MKPGFAFLDDKGIGDEKRKVNPKVLRRTGEHPLHQHCAGDKEERCDDGVADDPNGVGDALGNEIGDGDGEKGDDGKGYSQAQGIF